MKTQYKVLSFKQFNDYIFAINKPSSLVVHPGIKNKQGTHFAHTINGSGLAVGRTLIALLENKYEGGDEITLPKALQPYFGSPKIKIS